MASGSGGGRTGSRRRQRAQSRLTYVQMQAMRQTKRNTVRRMRMRRIDSSIPF